MRERENSEAARGSLIHFESFPSLRERDFDLILLDLRPGKDDGFQVLVELPTKHSRLPVASYTLPPISQ